MNGKRHFPKVAASAAGEIDLGRRPNPPAPAAGPAPGCSGVAREGRAKIAGGKKFSKGAIFFLTAGSDLNTIAIVGRENPKNLAPKAEVFCPDRRKAVGATF